MLDRIDPERPIIGDEPKLGTNWNFLVELFIVAFSLVYLVWVFYPA